MKYLKTLDFLMNWILVNMKYLVKVKLNTITENYLTLALKNYFLIDLKYTGLGKSFCMIIHRLVAHRFVDDIIQEKIL